MRPEVRRGRPRRERPCFKYVSCQKPVPPLSRGKFFHHCRCGSERAYARSESMSSLYCRIPTFIGIIE
jgi:hypothetical protein